MRKASGMVVIPKRRISSGLTTAAAAGALSKGVSFLKREFTETTSTLTNCSMLISARRAERVFVCPRSAAVAVERPAQKHRTHPGPEKERDPAIANSARPDLNLKAGLAVRFMHFFVFLPNWPSFIGKSQRFLSNYRAVGPMDSMRTDRHRSFNNPRSIFCGLITAT